MKKSVVLNGETFSQLIEARIQELGDWRGKLLARLRSLIKAADPGVVEEWKWNVPVWSHDGIICTGETYKSAVKLTFAKGASLPDPAGLFTSSLEGNTRRAIDIREGEAVDAPALKALVAAAAALNTGGASTRRPAAKAKAARTTAARKTAAKTTTANTAAVKRTTAKRPSKRTAAR